MALPPQENLETILLVEDHLTLLELLKQILERAGFTVLSAANAKDARALEAGYPGAIDLLLSDVRMRGMSGPDLAVALKERRPQMRVVLMSGYPGGALLALNYGWRYLQKPFKPSLLVHTVREVLLGEPQVYSSVGAPEKPAMRPSG